MLEFEQIGDAINKIAIKLSQDQKMARLLHYCDFDPLSQTHNDIILNSNDNIILKENILLIPKINENELSTNYIVITVPEGEISENDNFTNIFFTIDVVVPFDFWKINNATLRPILLMGRIKSLLNKSNVTGVGVLNFTNFKLDVVTDDVTIYKMIFEATTIE